MRATSSEDCVATGINEALWQVTAIAQRPVVPVLMDFRLFRRVSNFDGHIVPCRTNNSVALAHSATGETTVEDDRHSLEDPFRPSYGVLMPIKTHTDIGFHEDHHTKPAQGYQWCFCLYPSSVCRVRSSVCTPSCRVRTSRALFSMQQLHYCRLATRRQSPAVV